MEIDVALVRRLVRAQLPAWSDLPVAPVRHQGHDNRTFRLGEELSVRLPSHERYVAGVAKEDTFLPLLGAHLALPVPTVVAVGRPGEGYPHPWSVRDWIAGTQPDHQPDHQPDLDRVRLAGDVGGFLRELRDVPAAGGPAGGLHSFFRGCHPSAYADQVQAALHRLGDRVDVAACEAVWSEAVRTVWTGPPVWFHGDVAVGNLLVREGRLAAAIDFGTCGVGDPACDLVLAWTFLSAGAEREAFREAVALPDDAWRRARAWALWKALITFPDPAADGGEADDGEPGRVLEQVLADPMAEVTVTRG